MLGKALVSCRAPASERWEIMVKNRLAYGVVAIVLFLFVFLNEYRMTYMALYAILILPLISFVLTTIPKHRFHISEKLSTDFIVKEEVAQYRVIIHNKSFLPCISARIRLKKNDIGLEVDAQEKYVSISPLGNCELVFQISGKYRGAYEVGVVDITVYDFLGLFKFKQNHSEKLVLTVTPQIVPIPELSLDAVMQDANFSRNHLQGEDYSVISELRQYQPTDSYRKIHWKVSAKRNELISKDFQKTERRATVFFVDNSYIEGSLHQALKQEALKREDLMMEVVVSVMFYCHRSGYPISLHYLGMEREDATTDFNHLYKQASGLPFGRFSGFSTLLDNYLRLSKNPMNLLIFPQKINEKLLFTLHEARMAGNYLTIFLFEQQSDEVIKELETIGVRCIYFDEESYLRVGRQG